MEFSVSSMRQVCAWLLTLVGLPVAADQALIERGQYVFQLANCYSCHTDSDNDGPALAGGRALDTDFGTFYSPNITPDKNTGIGGWSDEDFIRALTKGISPRGEYYFPSFPYTSYHAMSRDDVLALKAYLFTQPPIARENQAHDIEWYLTRDLMMFWQWLNEWARPDAGSQSRGSYLIDTLGHCNECHTPRNALGIIQWDQRLLGNPALEAPNITFTEPGLLAWSDEELVDLFRYGALPDGDYVAGHMGEVVEYSTSKWNDTDLEAAIGYLKSLR